MTAKSSDSSTPFPKFRKEQTEAMLGVQKELLEACEQASRAWLAHKVRSRPLVGAGHQARGNSVPPEALGAYQECLVQRMQMAAEDWLRLSDDCQKVMQTITQSASNGRPIAST